jgi:hypothetical protein
MQHAVSRAGFNLHIFIPHDLGSASTGGRGSSHSMD